jgi:hypothetical protein
LTPRKVTALGLSREDVKKHAGAIDAILAKYRAAHGVDALPVVSDEVYVRRAYLEVMGRLPSLSERSRYLNQEEKDHRLALIDELITSEGYTQGMQIQCAQCHDHPFDRWNQHQFWELTAFLGDVKKKALKLAFLGLVLRKQALTRSR